jgi:hypothetical protein
VVEEKDKGGGRGEGGEEEEERKFLQHGRKDEICVRTS